MMAREEYQSLKIKHFLLESDANERRYISYTEGLTKTRNRRLNLKRRLISSKMYENKTESGIFLIV